MQRERPWFHQSLRKRRAAWHRTLSGGGNGRRICNTSERGGETRIGWPTVEEEVAKVAVVEAATMTNKKTRATPSGQLRWLCLVVV